MKITQFSFLLAMMCSASQSALAAGETVNYTYTDTDLYEVKEDYTKYTHVTEPAAINITGNGNTIIDGNNFQGFKFIGASNSYRIDTVITISGIKEMKNFVGVADGNSKTFEGGPAIKLVYGGTLNFEGYDENNRITFSGNKITSDGHSSGGGAVIISGGGSIGDLYADFYFNKLDQIETVGTTLQYGRGGALSVGNWNTIGSNVDATVGNIYGNFVGNEAEYGGAIYMGPEGVIDSVSGTFKNNIARASYKEGSTTGGSGGGAIRVHTGTIGEIRADFTGNISHATDGFSSGGALALENTYFTNNTIPTEQTGYISGLYDGNITFSNTDNAYGGAIALTNQVSGTTIHLADCVITGNIAGSAVDSSSKAHGGAMYFQNALNIYITALEKDVLISDNLRVWNAELKSSIDAESGVTNHSVTGGTRDYNALYASNSTITLDARGNQIITINDSMEGVSNSVLNITSSTTQEYGIYLNDEIRGFTVNVLDAAVKLGTYKHEDGTSTTADFQGGALNISANGTVNTQGDNISSAGKLANAGKIELVGGTLSKSINAAADLVSGTSSPLRQGHILVNADSTLSDDTANSGDVIVYTNQLDINANFVLSTNTGVEANTIVYKGANMHEINDGEQIIINAESIVGTQATLDFDLIRLDIDYANYKHYFDLIVSDDTGYINFDRNYDIEFRLAGVLLTKDEDYVVETLDDGGLRVLFVLPEPSTTTLSLAALLCLLSRRRRRG